MANLMARNGHLIADGGHLVAATTDCVQKCCGCLACTISGRIGTVTVSGLTSVTGSIVTDANDLCGGCPGLNGSYGGHFLPSTSPAPNTFLCGCYTADSVTECEGYLLEEFIPSLWALYNGSASTLNYSNPCGSGTIAVPPDYTYLYALLNTVADISGGSPVCGGCACFSVLQSGRIACPFSDLSLPLANAVGSCFCELGSASITVGIA